MPTQSSEIQAGIERQKIVGHTVTAIFGLVALSSLFLFITLLASKKNSKESLYRQKTANHRARLIYSLIFVFCTERAVLIELTLTDVPHFLTAKYRWAMCLIDMLPEALAFSIYLSLLFFIIDLEMAARKGIHSHNPQRLYIVWGFIVFISTIPIFLYAVWNASINHRDGAYHVWDYIIQEAIMGVLAFGLVVAMIVYTRKLFKLLQNAHLPSSRRRRMITKLRILVGFCIITYVFKVAQKVYFEQKLRVEAHYWETIYQINLIVYFVVTEAIPLALILFLLSVIFKKKKISQNKDKRPLLYPPDSDKDTVSLPGASDDCL